LGNIVEKLRSQVFGSSMLEEVIAPFPRGFVLVGQERQVHAVHCAITLDEFLTEVLRIVAIVEPADVYRRIQVGIEAFGHLMAAEIGEKQAAVFRAYRLVSRQSLISRVRLLTLPELWVDTSEQAEFIRAAKGHERGLVPMESIEAFLR